MPLDLRLLTLPYLPTLAFFPIQTFHKQSAANMLIPIKGNIATNAHITAFAATFCMADLVAGGRLLTMSRFGGPFAIGLLLLSTAVPYPTYC
jgi:hypothetical protein